jgi:hypothetical protein
MVHHSQEMVLYIHWLWMSIHLSCIFTLGKLLHLFLNFLRHIKSSKIQNIHFNCRKRYEYMFSFQHLNLPWKIKIHFTEKYKFCGVMMIQAILLLFAFLTERIGLSLCNHYSSYFAKDWLNWIFSSSFPHTYS